jgi:uncharacterized protein YkwD
MTDLRTTCHTAVGLLVALLAPAAACADVIDSVNAVRHVGCDGRHAGVTPLRENARLDEAAHRLSQGTDLGTALRFAGYHEVSSFSVSISNVPPSGDIERTIAQQFCHQVTNAAFREMGSWRNGARVWIALAEPFTPPAHGELGEVSRRVLQLANEARARPRRCGPTPYAAAPPLATSEKLSQVALAYAREMALWGYMDHTGRDGSSPGQRITRSGYRWSEVGENLASGVTTADAVVAGWLGSPEHCANLMDPLYRQVGVGFAVNSHDQRGIYWAMEFGTPR